MTATQQAYLEFLQTPQWLNLRWEAIKRDGRKCTRCQSRVRLQAHHVRYRATWAETQLDDLVTLCRDCHCLEHGLPLEVKPTRKRKPKGEVVRERLEARRAAERAATKKQTKLKRLPENWAQRMIATWRGQVVKNAWRRHR